MNLNLENHNLLNSGLSLKNELNLENNIEIMKKDTSKIITNILDKFAGYAIKAMPVPEGVKDILFDLKKVLKKRDFKQLLPTVINSSIREGLEVIGAPVTIIKDIGKLGEILKKGGLVNGLTAGIDIVANKYLKNNIIYEDIEMFFNKIKDEIKSRDFVNKLDSQMNKVEIKTEQFKVMCDNWYKAYESMDIENIKKIASNISKCSLLKGTDSKIKSENRIIQNMTKLINNKQQKLSNEQMQLCKIL